MAIKQNIVIDAGADFSIEFDVTNASNDAINFSSYTANAQLKKHYQSESSTEFETILYSNGAIIMTMSADITITLDPGRYVYDILVDDGSSKSRIVEGIATVTPGVST